MSAPAGEQAHEVHVHDRKALRGWLERNHARSRGVWLVYEKGRGRRLTYDDIVEEALCFGWIDSRPRARDESSAMLYLAPRRPTSRWSRRNKQRVERLTHAGLMRPAGLAAVAAAQESGAWAALDAVENLEEPLDLAAALDSDPSAREHWDAFPRSAKRAILEWIQSAKRAETRGRRIAATVGEAAAGRRANQWRRSGAGGPTAGTPQSGRAKRS